MSNILKISEAASIALHAMLILASKGNKLVSVKDIAGKLNISENHLSKVLQRLAKAGLVVSIKGNKGGFRLAKNPDTINFLEIYEAIDGKFKPSACLLNKPSCSHACIMGDLMNSINKQIEEYFSKTKLTEFILLNKTSFLED
ncbi:MAG TPA: Rrf2 family transcriptional regulator [Cyanobacteria bacterium UBA9971]|nr:Rrf2 family transcriptional regulator [Cyanobacteria bacterium UBA9971]